LELSERRQQRVREAGRAGGAREPVERCRRERPPDDQCTLCIRRDRPLLGVVPDEPSEEIVERADRAVEEAAGTCEQVALHAVDMRGRGLVVSYPELPEADAPRLERWLAALDDELGRLPAAETTVLCHSLGCLLWLHHDGPDVARALLVAPPQPDVEVAGAVG